MLRIRVFELNAARESRPKVAAHHCGRAHADQQEIVDLSPRYVTNPSQRSHEEADEQV